MTASYSISGRFRAMATLWQNRILRLLASKDPPRHCFRDIWWRSPLIGRPNFVPGLAALEGTIEALQSTMRYKGTEQGGTGRRACRTGQASTVRSGARVGSAAGPPR
jgi:hypothetical protein